jgi:prevent-host-death family protein
MRIVSIHEAKTQLSRLVDEASKGESFIIAKAGKPLVKVTPFDAPSAAQGKRIGFLAGQIEVPEDFDEMGREEIERLFATHGYGQSRRPL